MGCCLAAEVAHGQAQGYCVVPHPGPSQDPAESSCPLTAGALYCRMRETFGRTELIFLCSTCTPPFAAIGSHSVP